MGKNRKETMLKKDDGNRGFSAMLTVLPFSWIYFSVVFFCLLCNRARLSTVPVLFLTCLKKRPCCGASASSFKYSGGPLLEPLATPFIFTLDSVLDSFRIDPGVHVSLLLAGLVQGQTLSKRLS